MDTQRPGRSLPEAPRPSRLGTGRANTNELRAWCVAAASGDVDAFARLYAASQGWVLARCRSRLATHDAEDVCAEVFARAWRHLASGRDIEHPLAWLATVTRHLIIDFGKRAERAVPVGDLIGDVEIAGGQISDPRAGPAELADVTEVVPLVRGWLAELSPAARSAVTGAVTGEDQSATSRRTGCSLPALRSSLYRSRQRLRARLVARDLPCPPVGRC